MYEDKYKTKQRLLAERQVRLKINATPSEKKVFELLTKIGIDFFFQKGFISKGGFCIVDFYLPRPYRICIEIDGGYHNTEKQQRRDYCRENYLSGKRKLKILRIKNEDVVTMTASKLFMKIQNCKKDE
jgi:very-short-patch-repair endonuclease